MEAEAFCKTMDAELAVIPDMGRNEFVYRNLLPPAKREKSMFITTYFFSSCSKFIFLRGNRVSEMSYVLTLQAVKQPLT